MGREYPPHNRLVPEGPDGGSTTRAKCYLGHPDNFVEQREHRSMSLVSLT